MLKIMMKFTMYVPPDNKIFIFINVCEKLFAEFENPLLHTSLTYTTPTLRLCQQNLHFQINCLHFS